MELLLNVLQELLGGERVRGHVILLPEHGRLRAVLFKQGCIVREHPTDEGGWELDVDLARRDYDRLKKHEPVLAAQWQDK